MLEHSQDKQETGVSAYEVGPGVLPEETRHRVWQNFVSFLKRRGHNVTETRRIILDSVLRRR